MPQPDGPALKIARARHHIADINEQAASYYKNGSYRIYVQDVQQIGMRQLVTKIEEPVVDMFSPLVGDAVHNLRAALDLVVYEIVFPLLGPGDDEMWIAFPMPSNEKRLRNAFTKESMNKTPSAVREEIIKVCHPEDGDQDILALHHLDIRDKHRVLLFVVNDIGMGRFVLRDFDPTAPSIDMSGNRGVNIGMMFKGLEWAMRPQRPPPILVNERIQKHIAKSMTFDIRFNENEEPFALQSVVETLNRIADKVEAVVANLRAAAALPPN